MRKTLQNENPSARFFCLHKETLDKLVEDFEKAKREKDFKTFSVLAEMYMIHRKTSNCEGCTQGEKHCIHWSPEKTEVNRS